MLGLFIQLVLSSLLALSDAAVIVPEAKLTTLSVCTSCSGFLILTGPWGDNITQSIQLKCEVNVTENYNAGDMSLLLALDRDTTEVQPHTLLLVQSLPDGLRFTFTNEWVVPPGTFIFDFELSYRVDLGDTNIPGGYCSDGAALVVTTTNTVPTTTSPTTILSTETSTSQPETSVTSAGTTRTLYSPSTSDTSATSATHAATTSETPTSTSSLTSTNLLATSDTPATPVTSGSPAAVTSTSSTSTETSTSEPKDDGCMFDRLKDGNICSILLVAGLALAFLIFLAVLTCCIYYCGSRKREKRKFKDDKNYKNVRKRRNSSVGIGGQSAISGNVKLTKVQRIGVTPLDFV